MDQTHVGQGADWTEVGHKNVNNYEFLKEGNIYELDLLKSFYERHVISDGILCFCGRGESPCAMRKHSH
jgi:hypothetical protein